MKVLVTGAAGFIGFHLVQRLCAMNCEVVGLDALNSYYEIQLKYDRLSACGIDGENSVEHACQQSTLFPKYRFVRMHLEQREALMKLFAEEQFDVVCNLAAQAGVRYSIENPHAYVESNIAGFMSLLEACRNYPVKHLVYASSSSVYGLNTKVPFATSDSASHPVSLYAATKRSNELLAHSYSHLYRIPTTGLRFFTVYGPWGRPDMAPFLFSKAIVNGDTIKVFNYGKMKRDFTYVDDIIEGVVRVIQKPAEPSSAFDSLQPNTALSSAPYRIYNIGNSDSVELMAFIGALETALGREAKKEFLPMQAGDVTETYADVTDLEHELGYRPHVSIGEGVERFIKWYRTYYQV